MLNLKRWFVVFCLALACGAANSHPGHDNIEPIAEWKALVLGAKVVTFLVDRKKLPLSWENKYLKDISTRNTPTGIVWVVVFQNPGESDATRATLYVFLDEFGNSINANFSGEM